jgi:hypothetical protein
MPSSAEQRCRFQARRRSEEGRDPASRSRGDVEVENIRWTAEPGAGMFRGTVIFRGPCRSPLPGARYILARRAGSINDGKGPLADAASLQRINKREEEAEYPTSSPARWNGTVSF